MYNKQTEPEVVQKYDKRWGLFKFKISIKTALPKECLHLSKKLTLLFWTVVRYFHQSTRLDTICDIMPRRILSYAETIYIDSETYTIYWKLTAIFWKISLEFYKIQEYNWIMAIVNYFQF